MSGTGWIRRRDRLVRAQRRGSAAHPLNASI
jgi:hypothetical protein